MVALLIFSFLLCLISQRFLLIFQVYRIDLCLVFTESIYFFSPLVLKLKLLV